MSLLSRLFGRAEAPAAQPETYEGFQIFPEPVKEGGSFRIAARIEKNVNGEDKSHHLIRADTYSAQDTAIEASISKAKQLIDQQGDNLFGWP